MTFSRPKLECNLPWRDARLLAVERTFYRKFTVPLPLWTSIMVSIANFSGSQILHILLPMSPIRLRMRLLRDRELLLSPSLCASSRFSFPSFRLLMQRLYGTMSKSDDVVVLFQALSSIKIPRELHLLEPTLEAFINSTAMTLGLR